MWLQDAYVVCLHTFLSFDAWERSLSVEWFLQLIRLSAGCVFLCASPLTSVKGRWYLLLPQTMYYFYDQQDNKVMMIWWWHVWKKQRYIECYDFIFSNHGDTFHQSTSTGTAFKWPLSGFRRCTHSFFHSDRNPNHSAKWPLIGRERGRTWKLISETAEDYKQRTGIREGCRPLPSWVVSETSSPLNSQCRALGRGAGVRGGETLQSQKRVLSCCAL